MGYAYQEYETLIAQSPTLSQYQKTLLKQRYLLILRNFQIRCVRYTWLFHMGRIMVTVGSLLVPALMAIQYTKNSLFEETTSELFESRIYWVTWAISLMVTIANGIMTLMKIDKRYFFLHTTYEQLQSEGWQYLQLTGRYSGVLNKVKKTPTHANQFVYFCYFIEKLKMNQVQEEYFKMSEVSKTSTDSDNKVSEHTTIEPKVVMELSQSPSFIGDVNFLKGKLKEIPPVSESVETPVEDQDKIEDDAQSITSCYSVRR